MGSVLWYGDGARPASSQGSPSVFAKFFSFLPTEPFVKLSFILSLKEILLHQKDNK